MPSIKPRRTEVVLFQGDDFDRIEHLAAEVSVAAQVAASTAPRLGDDNDSEARVKAQEYDEFVQAAKDRGEVVVVVARPRKEFRALVVKHPARAENDEDKRWGFDYEAMGDDLVPVSVPLVDPETGEAQFASEAEREAFLDSLSDGDFSRIYSAAIKVNQGGAPDPFGPSLSSRLGQTLRGSSEPPERLG